MATARLKAYPCKRTLTHTHTHAARYTIRSFGIRRNEKIACHVTVSGEKAEEILNKVCTTWFNDHFTTKRMGGIFVNCTCSLGRTFVPACFQLG